MASITATETVGYECEFVDEVPDDYVCKHCKKVARSPSIVSCCGECFCKACVELISQEKLPCPGCEETVYSSLGHVKYEKKIRALQVYCSLRGRGCTWSGDLQHLEIHLNPTSGDCEYIDVDCPNGCGEGVQKHLLGRHIKDYCPRRQRTCSYCNYKGSYEDVTVGHKDVCPYIPLQCPNRCGVSCERDLMEDHLSVCSLSKKACDFKPFGCSEVLKCKDLKKHRVDNTQQHLTLLASALAGMTETLEKVAKLEKKLEDQEKELRAQDKRILELEKADMELNQQMVEKGIENVSRNLYTSTIYEFKVRMLKAGEDSPGPGKYGIYSESRPVYTHPGGYKFKVGVYPDGLPASPGSGSHVSILLITCQGEFDDKIKWPAEFTVTLEIVNQLGDKGHHVRDLKCNVEKKDRSCSKGILFCYQFIAHSDLEYGDVGIGFLSNGVSSFRITKIVVSMNS